MHTHSCTNNNCQATYPNFDTSANARRDVYRHTHRTRPPTNPSAHQGVLFTATTTIYDCHFACRVVVFVILFVFVVATVKTAAGAMTPDTNVMLVVLV